MPPEESREPFERRLRHAIRSQRAILSEIILAAGLLLTVLALGFFTPLSGSEPFSAINSVTAKSGQANYNLLFVILGPIIVILGAYLVGAYFYARTRFDHLMLTKSKAEFLRNIPELEDLLWDLTPRDEVRYQDRLAELRLRR